MDAFAIACFAPNGELLGSSELQVSELSSKWLGVCTELIEAGGPILDESMGSTLSDYRIKCTAGLCHFTVSGQLLYVAAIFPRSADEQNAQLMRVFTQQLGRTFPVDASGPLFLVVNLLKQDVPEADSAAMFQLAYHFAAAYLKWRDA